MHAHVCEHPAEGLVLVEERRRGGRPAEFAAFRRSEPYQAPERPAVAEVMEIAARGEEALVQADRQQPAMIAGRSDHLLGLGQGRRDGFLTEHVPALPHGCDRLRGVETGWRGNDGQGAAGKRGLVHRAQRLGARECPRDLLERQWAGIHDRLDREETGALQRPQCRQVELLRHGPAADQDNGLWYARIHWATMVPCARRRAMSQNPA